jgi:hypothetical protein
MLLCRSHLGLRILLWCLLWFGAGMPLNFPPANVFVAAPTFLSCLSSVQDEADLTLHRTPYTSVSKMPFGSFFPTSSGVPSVESTDASGQMRVDLGGKVGTVLACSYALPSTWLLRLLKSTVALLYDDPWPVCSTPLPGAYLKTHLSRPDKLGDAVYSPHNSFYDIGIDWVQPYKSAKYSMGIVFIRCADIKEENKSKNWNCAIVGIIPGPKKPSNLGPHLSKLIYDFDRLSKVPMTVDEVYYGPDGSLVHSTIHHFAFLGAVMADGPARTDLGCYRGHNSIHGACPWCIFEGATAPESSTVRFRGYYKGVTHSK